MRGLSIRIIRILMRRWLVWFTLYVMVLLTLNIIGMYLVNTNSVDPHNAFHTWILRDVPQLFKWIVS